MTRARPMHGVWRQGLLLATLMSFAPLGHGAHAAASDAQIRKILIAQSLASYPGNCPCPYNTARNGSRCGGRSAYNRGGGYAPLCYPSDVTAQNVQAYRRTNSSVHP